MGERDREVHALWIERSKEAKQVRSRLKWEASLLPRAMVMFGPGLVLEPMSRFRV